MVGIAYSVQQIPYVLCRSTLRLRVRTLGSSRPEHFSPCLTRGVLSSHRVGLSFGDLARRMPAFVLSKQSAGDCSLERCPYDARRPTSLEVSLPFGACSQVRPRSIRRRRQASTTTPPAGFLTLLAASRRVSRDASLRARGLTIPSTAIRAVSQPADSVSHRLHPWGWLSVLQRFPLRHSRRRLSARRFPQQSPLLTIRA